MATMTIEFGEPCPDCDAYHVCHEVGEGRFSRWCRACGWGYTVYHPNAPALQPTPTLQEGSSDAAGE